MEKFTIGQPINYLELRKTIQHFINRVKTRCNGAPEVLQLKHRSNIFINNDIDFNFLYNCILHCVLHQLAGAVAGLDSKIQVNASQKMRQFYFKKTTQGGWKKQFDFQQAIVCATKMVAEFYNQMFTNVCTNPKLESQIFIILVHTLMGINVGMKCFQVLQRKYLKQESDHKLKQEPSDARRTFVSKITSRQSMFMHSLSNMASTSSHFSKIKEVGCKDESQQFKEMIKQSLHIDPLPKIKKSKKSIQSFGDQDCFHTRLSHSINPKQYQHEARKKPLYSTQISLSLKSQIQKRHVSIAENNRPFKIKHRTPFHSSHLVVFRKNLTKDNLSFVQNSTPKQKQQSKKLSSFQWQKQINSIKQNINLCQSFKLNSKNGIDTQMQKKFEREKCHYQQLQNSEISDRNLKFDRKLQVRKTVSSNSHDTYFSNAKQNTELLIKEESQLDIKKGKNSDFHQEEQENPVTRLDYGIKNYRQVKLIQNEDHFEKVKKTSFNPKQLKQKKTLFDLHSKQRRNKIQYSMFMLPSMKIQFNK